MCIIGTVMIGLGVGFASYWVALLDREAKPEEFHLADNGLAGSAAKSLLPAIQLDPAIAQVAADVQPCVITLVVETKDFYDVGISLGSGVVFREDEAFYYAITNAHVLADSVGAYLYTKEGELVAISEGPKDEEADLALIRIPKADLPEATVLKPAVIGDSDTLRSGDVVIVVGSPEDIAYQNSVTVGVVSHPSREALFSGRPSSYIQTDAAINPGNSGGGLFTLDGCLVGIISNKFVQTDLEGLGFAIPINRTMDKIETFLQE